MKTMFVPLLAILIGFATVSFAQTEKKDGPVFKFKEGDTHDFGEVPLGPDVTYEFTFTNVGNQPLIITDANPSCSCTTPEWIKQPVLPGQTGWIKVGYKTKDHAGPFVKEVYIQSNAVVPNGEKRYTIHIKGTVK
jgi:Protein of unknown function (DUF1573)